MCVWGVCGYVIYLYIPKCREILPPRKVEIFIFIFIIFIIIIIHHHHLRARNYCSWSSTCHRAGVIGSQYLDDVFELVFQICCHNLHNQNGTPSVSAIIFFKHAALTVCCLLISLSKRLLLNQFERDTKNFVRARTK